jgi:hypothetical protein
MSPAWFFPGLTLLSGSIDTSALFWTPSSYEVDSLGDHLGFQFTSPNSNSTQKDPRLLSPFDLVLAPDTHLPQYALFTVYSDNPSVTTGIPVSIAYSNYRSTSGVMVPYHIQRYVNGSLVIDVSISAVSIQ